MSENENCNLIPEGYSNIDDLWCDVRYEIIKDVIGSAIRHISFDIPDFKPKWSDVPEEKIDKWHDFVFGYDVSQWKQCTDDRAFPDTHYGNKTKHIIEYRLYDLRCIIIDFFMEKFNIKVVNGKYARNLDEENNVKPEQKEINEQA